MNRISIDPISDRELDLLIRQDEKYYTGKSMDALALSALYELRGRREKDRQNIEITPPWIKPIEIRMMVNGETWKRRQLIEAGEMISVPAEKIKCFSEYIARISSEDLQNALAEMIEAMVKDYQSRKGAE